MNRRTFWQGLCGSAVIALLTGCGSDNSPNGIILGNTIKTQSVTKATGGTVPAGNSSVTIPPNALSQDATVSVTDSPSNLSTATKVTGLIGSTAITASGGATIAAGSTLTLTLPTSHTDKYPIYAYRVDSGTPVEVDAIAITGNKATIPISSFGTYAFYNPIAGALPASPSTTQPDNLVYEETAVGTGATAVAGSHVSVHYVGTLRDGTVFDSNSDTQTPLMFTVGTGVVTGFSEGVTGMKVGGWRRIGIPPALGYGDAGNPPAVPGNAELIFDVQLLSAN